MRRSGDAIASGWRRSPAPKGSTLRWRKSSELIIYRHPKLGEVVEWFKAPVLKTGVGASLPWVRIPPSPPFRSALNLAPNDDIFDVRLREHRKMRTTLALDDELLDRAQSLTGVREKSALVREALKALIERES